LKTYREKAGLKQYEVAKILTLEHSGNISRWEKGYILPSIVHLFNLSAIYKVNPVSLYPELWNLIITDFSKKVEEFNTQKILEKFSHE
jgi:transcriptional regulator with XRE-family HTH domain